MRGFVDEGSAARVLGEIGSACHRDTADFLRGVFGDLPLADAGLARFRRLVGAMSAPGSLLSQMESAPGLARTLGVLLSTSHHLGDLLVQNPELATMVLDPEMASGGVTREEVAEEGRRLLAYTTSYAHRLDRLRYLKQKHLVRTAGQDIGGHLPPWEIWRGLSELAEGILSLTREAVWRQVGGDGECPVSIIVLGKMGGLELNYSSDIDLIFVMSDEVGAGDERAVTRYCELLRGALADRMGRGDLYRVDLRLRPFGSQGALVVRARALEGYYERYAEPWEHLAMIRSRVVGSEEVRARWEGLRERTVFRGPRSEWVLSELLKMRRRSEVEGDAEDLKRGAGGIRDIEFIAQISQMLHGQEDAVLREAGTLGALDRLSERGLLGGDLAERLRESYVLLRQVEHRCQIVGNLQTHRLPVDAGEREAVAWSLGARSAGHLEVSIEVHRRGVRDIYEQEFGHVLSLSEQQGVVGVGSGGYERALVENFGSLSRLKRLTEEAPALVAVARRSEGLMEQILSGEIEEGVSAEGRLAVLGEDWDSGAMSEGLRSVWARALARWVLVPGVDLQWELTEGVEAGVRALVRRWGEGFAVLGLGSFGAREMGPTSDADLVVFWVGGGEGRGEGERRVAEGLQEVRRLRGAGAPFSVDLRLRPEGRSGRLTVTPDGFLRYAAEHMEVWERFAFGRSRWVVGAWEGLEEALGGKGWGFDELRMLFSMKRRIENERVNPLVRSRHVKLGDGGIDDAVWCSQVGVFLALSAGLRGAPLGVVDRLEWLVGLGLMECDEARRVGEGWRFLQELRTRMYLLGVTDDVMPESPDKLGRLAAGFGLGDANALLAEHRRHTGAIRGAWLRCLEAIG